MELRITKRELGAACGGGALTLLAGNALGVVKFGDRVDEISWGPNEKKSFSLAGLKFTVNGWNAKVSHDELAGSSSAIRWKINYQVMGQFGLQEPRPFKFPNNDGRDSFLIFPSPNDGKVILSATRYADEGIGSSGSVLLSPPAKKEWRPPDGYSVVSQGAIPDLDPFKKEADLLANHLKVAPTIYLNNSAKSQYLWSTDDEIFLSVNTVDYFGANQERFNLAYALCEAYYTRASLREGDSVLSICELRSDIDDKYGETFLMKLRQNSSRRYSIPYSMQHEYGYVNDSHFTALIYAYLRCEPQTVIQTLDQLSKADSASFDAATKLIGKVFNVMNYKKRSKRELSLDDDSAPKIVPNYHTLRSEYYCSFSHGAG